MEKPIDLYPSQQQTREILKEILDERLNQENKWGQQNHALERWNLILGEERGEVEKAILEWIFGSKPLFDVRKELIQVADVAVAMIESLDRNERKVAGGVKEWV